ncbi:hypothetical protein ACFE04_018891 [Oxalis oulophora]
METEIPIPCELEVTIIRESIIKASYSLPNPQIITLSNLDLLSGRFPVTYLYFYRKAAIDNFAPIVESLKGSLAETLNYFYPFAGQIIQNPETNEPEIVCNNNGAVIVEAQANIPLKKLNFYNFDEYFQGKLVSVNPDIPLQIQVTNYTCGGVSLTFTFDHALGDASSFGKFLLSWSEISQLKPVTCVPDHQRKLKSRCPPTYHPSLDETFMKCTIQEIINMPPNNILLKRLYYIDAATINKLQTLASANGKQRTKIEAFSAYIWKIMVNAIEKNHEKCKMGWLVDGRRRIDQNAMSNYIGNVLSLAVAESSVVKLKQSSISDVASNIHEAILKVTNKEHFLDLIDWVECHRPGLMLPKTVLGQGGPTLVLSSGRRFPITELDFGFGSPTLGTVCSTIERIGVGYMNQRESAKGDGSWTVSTILWPKLATALESDCVLQPMSASHLQL